MPISISYDDIRGALDEPGNEEDYPDSSLTFKRKQAEGIVNDELLPYTDKEARLEVTGALLAAAYVIDDEAGGEIESVQQGNRVMTFNTSEGLSKLEEAIQQDPTGRLIELTKATARIDSPSVRE